MTAEAKWRIDMVRELDPAHRVYLHVVPDRLTDFNPVSCVDDFAIASLCDVFAASTNADPVSMTQTVSAAQGRVCYNVESHINFGSARMHQRVIESDDLLRELVPQIGFGLKGFLFWQFRPETLGAEAPAWGMVNPDGSSRAMTDAAASIWQKLQPHARSLLASQPASADVGIYRSRSNELFHFAVEGSLEPMAKTLRAYTEALYWNNHRFRYINTQLLKQGKLEDIRLLILPSPYYLSQEEAECLDQWVQRGGVLLSEAHLGAYDATHGRSSEQVPGCGLAEKWGLHEQLSTSSWHLDTTSSDDPCPMMTDDERKAMPNLKGAAYFPIHRPNGEPLWSAIRYAELACDHGETLGYFAKNTSCLNQITRGAGQIIYAGGLLGLAAHKNPETFNHFIATTATIAGARASVNFDSAQLEGVRVDPLYRNKKLEFIAVTNRTHQTAQVKPRFAGEFEGLYTGSRWSFAPNKCLEIPAGYLDVMKIID